MKESDIGDVELRVQYPLDIDTMETRDSEIGEAVNAPMVGTGCGLCTGMRDILFLFRDVAEAARARQRVVEACPWATARIREATQHGS